MAAWFRCYADIADNYKLKMLAFEDRWHYIAILSCKSTGMLDGKRNDFVFRTVAARLGLSKSELEEVARRLAENYLIDEKTLQPVGWDDRQFVSDNSKDRTRKYRINKKSCDVTTPSLKRHCDVPDTDTDTDTEKKKKPRASRLSPDWVPNEVDLAYCREKRPELDPLYVTENFRDYWISQPGAKGMKQDWSATWRTWVRNERGVTVQGRVKTKTDWKDLVC